jgi:O-antigen/teichoic acid export membrane protein
MPVSSVALALLESRLAFRSIGIVLALQSITFSVVACLLAVGGLGVVSAGAGLLATNLVSAATAAAFARWLPRPSVPAVKDLGVQDRLRFGLPFIASTGVSVVKDAVSPMFLGLVFGAAAVGYVNWAQTLAVLGMLMLFPLGRVFFPVFVKVREHPARLQSAVVRATFWSYALVAPITVFVGLNIDDVTVVVYGDQWLPAVSTLLLLTGANLLSPAVNVLFILLNVQGRPGITLRYTLGFCVATWIFVPVAASIDDFRGYGWANLLVTAIGLPLVVGMRRYYAGHALDMLRPWGAAVIGVGLGRLVGGIPDDRAIGLAVSLSVAVVAYVGMLLGLAGSYTRELVQVVRSRSRA